MKMRRALKRFPHRYAVVLLEDIAPIIAILVLVFAGGVAFADQAVKVKPDGVVTGFVSTTEQTRIHVEGDRIRRLMAPPQGFEAINDSQTGDVYLTPLPVEHGSRVAASFIITEKGHTVQLRLKPQKKAAKQVMITIEDGGAPVPVASRAVRNAPYVDELVAFSRYVIRGEQPAGVEVRRGLSNPFGSDRVVEAEWESSRFVAEVLRVTAESGPLTLTENQFLMTGIAAIWISDKSLAAGEVARVILIWLKG